MMIYIDLITIRTTTRNLKTNTNENKKQNKTKKLE